MDRVDRVQGRLERWTRKWWFFAAIVFLQLFPPYATGSYRLPDTAKVVEDVLYHSFYFSMTKLYPVFQVIPIILVAAVLLGKNRFTRVFSAYAAASYVLFAVVQNFARSERYGLAVVVNNVILFLIVAACWFLEVFARRNDFTAPTRNPWRYWVVPAALLAFWLPINLQTLRPDFNPANIIKSGSGLAFCMMTPVYMAILVLYFPRVNLVTMRVTGLAGSIIGVYNILFNFALRPGEGWWLGVLHIPLLAISAYGLVLSFSGCAETVVEEIPPTAETVATGR